MEEIIVIEKRRVKCGIKYRAITCWSRAIAGYRPYRVRRRWALWPRKGRPDSGTATAAAGGPRPVASRSK